MHIRIAMTEEQPSFRLVSDNSAFVRKPGEPPPDLVNGTQSPLTEELNVATMRLSAAEEEKEKKKREVTAPSSTTRECGGCSKAWPENYLVRKPRTERGKAVELWVCPVCERTGGYEEVDTPKIRVRGGEVDTTKLFIGFAVALVVIASLLFWKFHSDTVNEKVEWITEEWAKEPAAKWPALLGEWEAQVQGASEPARGAAFFLERRDGSVVAVGCAEEDWLITHNVKASRFSDLAGKVQATLRVPGKPELKPGEFFRPEDPTAGTLWVMSVPAVDKKQFPSEPLKIRRQTFGLGCMGTLVCLVGGKQKSFAGRVIQGVQGGDEFMLQMDTPIPPESVRGSLFIDEFGHLVAVGAEVAKLGSARTEQRLYVRNALRLKGFEK